MDDVIIERQHSSCLLILLILGRVWIALKASKPNTPRKAPQEALLFRNY